MPSTNSDQYGAAFAQPGAGMFGNLKVLYGSIEIATAQAASDTVNFFTAPAGFTPLFGWLMGDDLDTDATETIELDIGITGDTTKYLNSGALNGDAITNWRTTVGIFMPLQEELMTVKPTEFTSDTDIICDFNAAAATGGTGTLTLIMCGLYRDERVV